MRTSPWFGGWMALALGAAAPGCGGARPQAALPGAPSAPSATPGATSATSATSRRHVVVSIVVDQLAAWIGDQRFGELPPTGGFARLRREGTYARDVRYAHASTDTAPGHSALYTGAVPRDSGIFGNEVPGPGGEKISVLLDESTRLLAAAPTTKPGSSAKALRVETVADRFRAAQPKALIVSLSIKDRGAIFAGGRAPSASVWWDKKLGFVTSTAFAAALPAFVTRVDLPRRWELAADERAWVASHAKTPDAQPGEGDLAGLGVTFPHEVKDGNAFRATPFADEALVAMGEAAIAKADGPTLLALSFSANDYVGHTFGPDSWEAWDELLRLDARLGELFAWLDRTFGADGWDAILSADHGVTTMPEAANDATRPWCARDGGRGDRWQRACGPVSRVFPKALGVLDPYAYLRPGEDAAAFAAKLRAVPEVDRVYDARAIPTTCPPESDESVDALVCRAFVPGHGDLYVVLKRGDFFDPDVVEGKGSSHGSPYLFDRSVPLLVRAPGRAAAGKTIDAPLSFRAFARTLSSLLGVEPADPEAARAVDLTRGP